jgi:L-rhamnose mutarotase
MDELKQPDAESSNERRVIRIGMVVGIKSDQIEAYKRLHAGPGVRALLRQANMHNFSIFLRQFDDGKYYEFAYYEYTGTDYEADMAWLAAQPENKQWLAMCDPMQTPLAGETGWAVMDSIYYNE